MSGSIRRVLFAALAGLALTFGAGGASADTVSYSLSATDAVGLGTGPYGTVSVTTNGTNIATVVFTANTAGGYAFIDGSSAGVNVTAGAYTSGSISGTLSPLNSGGTVALTGPTTQNVNGFGTLNTVFDNGGGWSDALATITFTLTKTSGTWGSASTVLANDDKGFPVEAHVGFCAPPATSCSTVPATGFTSVPIPAAAWLFGSGLVGLIAIARRRIKGSDSPTLA